MTNALLVNPVDDSLLKVNNRNTRATSILLMSLLLPLNIFHTLNIDLSSLKTDNFL